MPARQALTWELSALPATHRVTCGPAAAGIGQSLDREVEALDVRVAAHVQRDHLIRAGAELGAHLLRVSGSGL